MLFLRWDKGTGSHIQTIYKVLSQFLSPQTDEVVRNSKILFWNSSIFIPRWTWYGWATSFPVNNNYLTETNRQTKITDLRFQKSKNILRSRAGFLGNDCYFTERNGMNYLKKVGTCPALDYPFILEINLKSFKLSKNSQERTALSVPIVIGLETGPF